ncbi:hypothetical protein UFOVP26_105 [uncultured Caudovirales phage]|uniref:HNHc domain containing protein n=1 Tax=uncultured Caudovirales phage TaxID=2100421 RepID=A0A6J5KMW5_9CAUD|nr:hypothetical protein UFOVP26_105 [uncultured Caudovirales phage]CAB4124022.1 hypothetical protein UFOVP44_130 [uncultured Caudovirales phage]CAB5219677.1 hypothetical protein UFOVP220_121 [uncultured Caudovirales phage]
MVAIQELAKSELTNEKATMKNYNEMIFKMCATIVLIATIFMIMRVSDADAAGLVRPYGVIVITTTKEMICTSGYSASVRPSINYTNAIKRKWLPKGHKVSEYELDHYIPISLGGSPTEESNLWLQDWADAKRKDVLEKQLHRDVCSGKITLRQAQFKIDSWK